MRNPRDRDFNCRTGGDRRRTDGDKRDRTLYKAAAGLRSVVVAGVIGVEVGATTKTYRDGRGQFRPCSRPNESEASPLGLLQWL